MNPSEQAFFALLKGGLWEQDVKLAPYDTVVFDAVYKLAEEQSVVGLIAAGIEHVKDKDVDRKDVMPFLANVIAIENRNRFMNAFVLSLIAKLRNANVYALLVKGQGIGQCYERPLWRAAGDVDLFLDKENYEKAKSYLLPQATECEIEDKRRLHLGMTIDNFIVELHGTLHTDISRRIDRDLDDVQHNVCKFGDVRSWYHEDEYVFLPGIESDIVIVFTHILNHFFVGGIGLRQICDWCRLLWTYRDKIKVGALERRLKDMGIMSEWKAFAAFAVEYLGMPAEAIPFYSESAKNKTKSKLILRNILATGNLGHNKDYSYRSRLSGISSKVVTFIRRLGETIKLTMIFPVDGPKFFLHYTWIKVRSSFHN